MSLNTGGPVNFSENLLGEDQRLSEGLTCRRDAVQFHILHESIRDYWARRTLAPKHFRRLLTLGWSLAKSKAKQRQATDRHYPESEGLRTVAPALNDESRELLAVVKQKVIARLSHRVW